jgi:hypothetical protein
MFSAFAEPTTSPVPNRHSMSRDQTTEPGAIEAPHNNVTNTIRVTPGLVNSTYARMELSPNTGRIAE